MTKEFALYFAVVLVAVLNVPVFVMLILQGVYPDGAPEHWQARYVIAVLSASVLAGIFLGTRVYMRIADMLEERGWRADATLTKGRVVRLLLVWFMLICFGAVVQVRLFAGFFDLG